MDRNEGDHLGNLAELRRMLKALSLETVCVWLGGDGIAALRRVEEAELIISLPYGRAAARRLARQTGARLVEAELPFGLLKSERFMRDVGKAAGKGREAESFIAGELSRVIPRLQWIIPQKFLGRRAAFMGDPYLLGGFLDIAEDLGMSVSEGIARGRAAHAVPATAARILYEPRSSSPEVRQLLGQPLDIFVSCWCEAEFMRLGFPVMEFGFPSYRHHALDDRPFLGFNGVLAFVERMADQLGAGARRSR
jgi:nitrogenase molybdenum-iron protein alpha/beta subunit